jgi:Mycothiol maleylpyruvate isomerase N-terminal domain
MGSRSREAEAFLSSLQDLPPEVVSGCDGWTVHEITAHLAATAAEVTRHLVPYLEGRPVPATASFEEREPPFRALGDGELRLRLEAEEDTAQIAIASVLAEEADAEIPWTGRQMAVAKFLPHLRNEYAIHRWDIAGDDDVSAELLGQGDLTEHAVTVLGQILVIRGKTHDPRPGEDLQVRLRSPGAADVHLNVEAGAAGLEFGDRSGDPPTMELDAAARTLVLWGRRPGPPSRIRSHLEPAVLARTQVLLSGY